MQKDNKTRSDNNQQQVPQRRQKQNGKTEEKNQGVKPHSNTGGKNFMKTRDKHDTKEILEFGIQNPQAIENRCVR